MKVLIQNLQKREGLASSLDSKFNPDIILAQEIKLQSESLPFEAHNVSRMGYGTAIGIGSKNANSNANSNANQSASFKITKVLCVESPYAEFGGLIHKKTTLASVEIMSPSSDSSVIHSSTCNTSSTIIQIVSFHGYNGQPFQSVEKLVSHVDAVLVKLQSLNLNSSSSDDNINNDNSETIIKTTIPALFAGDFNTWTQSHIDAVTKRLEDAGFHHIYSWPYPGRDLPLDHAFVRGSSVVVRKSQYFECASDHRGAILELEV